MAYILRRSTSLANGARGRRISTDTGGVSGEVLLALEPHVNPAGQTLFSILQKSVLEKTKHFQREAELLQKETKHLQREAEQLKEQLQKQPSKKTLHHEVIGLRDYAASSRGPSLSMLFSIDKREVKSVSLDSIMLHVEPNGCRFAMVKGTFF